MDTAAAPPESRVQSSGTEPVADRPLSAHDVFTRVGMLTRNLHDALRELGYHTDIEASVGSLPDARARLEYVAKLTGQAADRVLSATERAKAHQDGMRQASATLEARWTSALHDDAEPLALRALGHETQVFLDSMRSGIGQVDAELTEIMVAQEFHDLTGQVIKRITVIAQSVEEQLIKLLLEASPPGQRADPTPGALDGPVINAAGRDDVVVDQQQADALLESLGF